ncbi:MAG: TMEM165/GDT1 family protein [Alphaproteobacteria bacterium]|nr:TMEM165/GDT1 family protein [Alphaproteobacteria bacterium]
MDWKLAATAFATIFIAELGDKTNLATMALSGGSQSKWAVFLGASAGLIATTALGVLAGDLVSRYVPELWVNRGAGVMFIVIGLFFLVGKSA